MVMLKYPAVSRRMITTTILVTFPDFDDAVTCGDTRREALAHA